MATEIIAIYNISARSNRAAIVVQCHTWQIGNRPKRVSYAYCGHLGAGYCIKDLNVIVAFVKRMMRAHPHIVFHSGTDITKL